MTPNRIDEIRSEIWQIIFCRLDQEFELSAMDAGDIATKAEQLIKKELEKIFKTDD